MDVILDCYTDEPAGLGVPPYIGTYPRYVYGALGGATYLTIDDLRNLERERKEPKPSGRTDIRRLHLTRPRDEVRKALDSARRLVVIAGIHTPGKYLSAEPGTLPEIVGLIRGIRAKKVLTGPAGSFGSRLEGGKHVERADLSVFDHVDPDFEGISDYQKVREYTVKGAELARQLPWEAIAELETGHGCYRAVSCSFCTEPLKNRQSFRNEPDIIEEAKALNAAGIEHFRLGKQACFYSYKGRSVAAIKKLLKGISALQPRTLHIDNVNPIKVLGADGKRVTKLIATYCTPGNVAAFGVESFDPEVVRANRLNTTPEIAMEAVRIVNQFGGERGQNGMPKFLPGINILLGLIDESKTTLGLNLEALKRIYDEGLMLRRINIRQVVPFPGTALYAEAGTRFIQRNKKRYYSFRDSVRKGVDLPMLRRVVPEGTVLKDLQAEVWDGKTTFCRQLGTYPLIVGVKDVRLPLQSFHDVRVTGHMLRSLVGELA